MYDYIKGILAGKSNTSKGVFLTVEAGGIGYLLETTVRDYNLADGDEVKVYTVLIHREDKMSLCGFLHKEDRDIFNIGFVIDGNYKEITRAKGVGPKLAQKIILELKDKLMNYKTKEPIKITSSVKVDDSAVEDAQMVLVSLGYERKEIQDAISKAVADNRKTAEEILKEALKILSL